MNVSGPPASAEIAAALGRFFTGGSGPRHSSLTSVFTAHGFGDVAPYVDGLPNKEDRVRQTIIEAARSPRRARGLVDALLGEMRAERCFYTDSHDFDKAKVITAQQAFRRAGWMLADDGVLSSLGAVDLDTGGREVLDEQLGRLRKATDDPALLLGTAKELLESVAKFVLEGLGAEPRKNADFGELWYLARERLGLLPESISSTEPGAQSVKKILGNAWVIAEQVNTLRCREGTGHGRTLPTGVTPEVALLVVREACSVAELTLRTLDGTRVGESA